MVSGVPALFVEKDGKRRYVSVRRVIYRSLYGEPPPRHRVYPSCRVPSCVRDEHARAAPRIRVLQEWHKRHSLPIPPQLLTTPHPEPVVTQALTLHQSGLSQAEVAR